MFVGSCNQNLDRAIYSDKFGFLGGFSWSMMLAFVFQQNPSIQSVEDAIGTFFTTYSKWDLTKFICLIDKPHYVPHKKVVLKI